MIIIRSPLRISIGGGGTDIPSYYEKKGSFFISAAINKYVYVTITKPFEKGIYLKYSEIEKVNSVNKISHKIIKEVLKKELIENKIEITTLTDIPSKTGLGSSGSFSTALLKAIYSFNNKFIGKMDLAEKACDIEINQLKQPSGKQDQYISVYGGISEFRINKSGKVKVKNLNISSNIITKLERNLLLFFTGFSRNSSLILNEQNEKTKKKESEIIKNLDFVKSLGIEIKKELENGNCENFAKLMNTHWNYKLKRSKNMSNSSIDNLYSYALKNGALGGKLIGAGGGGFLLFYTNNPKKLRNALKIKKLEEVSFKFDYQGVKQIF
ncbi:MAG: galactokinase [Candidatus Pelagibacter sp.]|mgnify:CR=1 FL=1|nr:galactokinase [Candidatus Pelagibacter sp.]|tara:strand:- start:11712 stop:12686 length:975 start_codon:yes stop_codon:yes gene_type:complete